MRRLGFALLLSAGLAVAQTNTDVETRDPSHAGLRPSAGGPPMMGDGTTRAIDLGVAYEESDLVVRTGLGDLVIKRKYTSGDSWKNLPACAQHLGNPTDYGEVKDALKMPVVRQAPGKKKRR